MNLHVAAVTERHQVLKVIAATFAFRFVVVNLGDRHKPALFQAFFTEQVNFDISRSGFSPLPIVTLTAFVSAVPLVILFVM